MPFVNDKWITSPAMGGPGQNMWQSNNLNDASSGFTNPYKMGSGNYFMGTAVDPSMVASDPMAAGMDPSGAGGVAGAAGKIAGMASPGSLALGVLQTGIGLYGLAKLGQEELPEYSAGPELIASQNAAAQNAKFGYSPQQKAAFDANIGMGYNTTMGNARAVGGNSVARAVSGITRGNNLNAFNTFAAQDFQNKQSNQRYSDDVGQQKQALKDKNTTMQWNRRNALEQQYGQAMSSGLTNSASAFNLGAALKYMA